MLSLSNLVGILWNSKDLGKSVEA